MPEPINYRLPSKLKKFGIVDPFLQLFVAKYENEIPWQQRVKDSETLIDFIEKELYPGAVKRVTYPIVKGTRHVFLQAKDIQLDRALREWNSLFTSKQQAKLQTAREEGGDQAVTEELTQLLNQRKHQSFKDWIKFLDREYSHNRAFALLILRPLIDLYSKRVRRTPAKHSAKAIGWLYRQIERQQVSPNENLAQLYFRKLAFGNRPSLINGWTFIPEFEEANKLTSAAQGSGWCISSRHWAEHFGEDSFYILRHAGKPVVAVRFGFQRVQEIQGVCNTIPTDWFDEIDLLLETQGLANSHLGGGFSKQECDQRELNRIGQPLEWWRSQVKTWPFAIFAATEEYFEALLPEVRNQLSFFCHFPKFQANCQRAGVGLDLEDWCKIIEAEPTFLKHCPLNFQQDPRIKNAQIQGWCGIYKDGFFELRTIEDVPKHILSDKQFKKTVLENRSILQKLIRHNPRSRKERENRSLLANLIGLDDSSPLEMVQERAVHHILSNQTGVYLKEEFPKDVREHTDFESLYRNAWLEALVAHPPLILAMPAELKKSVPPLKARKDIDLKRWRKAVRQTPWLLTQKNGVPKSIRLHPEIIAAYVDGWKYYLQKNPNQIWVKRGIGRVYMSYALLADDSVIEALADGWTQKMNKISDAWGKASARMRQLPSFQLAILRAISRTASVDADGKFLGKGKQKQIAKGIFKLHSRGAISAEPKMLEEIASLTERILS